MARVESVNEDGWKIGMTHRFKTIAVDLTPILPGGENGGAKIFVLELLRRLGAIHPETRFILLTQAASHEELASMDSANISRRMVVGSAVTRTIRPRLEGLTRRLLPYLPIRLRQLAMALGYRLNTALKRGGSGTLLSDMGADLLFCPFTAPTYFEPSIATVCTIYDLQYKIYPEFFAPEDVVHRDRTFIEACRCANALTAISDYSREAAIRHGNLAPDRIHTIHLRMAQRIVAQPGERMDLLDRWGVQAGRYLIYPANFWRHKNHEMLLTALGMAYKAGLAADIKLVCTGAPSERQNYLARVTAMNLKKCTIFPGFLPDDELATLLANARGMVFPSLYEGFGLPVVEAMAAGVPIACSNLTSLPEVAADAAILFDPRIPTQIAEAIITLVEDEATRSRLIDAGRHRAVKFTDLDRMASEYWNLFLHAANQGPQVDLLTGVHADGWCGPQLALRLTPARSERMLEIELVAPTWLPASGIQMTVVLNDKTPHKIFKFMRGNEGSISIPLAVDVVTLRLQITPVFVPEHHGVGEDTRELTLQLRKCTLHGTGGSSRQLYPELNDSQGSGIESQ